MATITCKIPEKLDAALKGLARSERVAKSAIIRQALEEKIRRSRRRAAPTAFDIARSLCGAIHGPRDLSKNPRHLEGLGA